MPRQPMALFLSSQQFGKEAFRKVIVVFLTIIDLLTFAYFLLVGLIDMDMILKSLHLLPALAFGFWLGDFAFG